MRRNLDAVIADVDALADQLESYEPNSEEFDVPLPPRMADKFAAFKREAAERSQAKPAVRRAPGIKTP
ncbi:hypothetical protein AB1046_03215 [Promicromonospora sp. Populi]|uniref:hypothetical protein n=1 Tax=Promicromonospora sp. Populi TaxID=3239420 RepID=UPI0034E26C40